jgi:TP901-1 family phage major tail protein
MRSTGMTINGEQVDVTTKDDGEWRQLLESCGIKSMSITLAGAMTDEAKLNEMIADVVASLHSNYQITSDLDDSFEGAFETATFERSGEVGADEQFSVTLESAGDVEYTPAP